MVSLQAAFEEVISGLEKVIAEKKRFHSKQLDSDAVLQKVISELSYRQTIA